jgi:hypothetical protein
MPPGVRVGSVGKVGRDASVGKGVKLAVGIRDVGLGTAVGTAGVPVSVGWNVLVSVGTGVNVGRRVAVFVDVGDAVGVIDDVGVWLGSGVSVGVRLGVTVSVGVGESVWVGDGTAVEVRVLDGVGVHCMAIWVLSCVGGITTVGVSGASIAI